MAKSGTTGKGHRKRKPGPPVVTYIEGEKLIKNKATGFAYFYRGACQIMELATRSHRRIWHRPLVVTDRIAPDDRVEELHDILGDLQE